MNIDQPSCKCARARGARVPPSLGSVTPGPGEGALSEARQPPGAGEAPAHAHALLLVDVQGVGFDRQVVLQGGLAVDQRLQGVLRVPQALLQRLDGVVHLVHLVNQAAWGRGTG